MTFVLSLGAMVVVQPLRQGFDALARALGRRPASSRLSVTPMSPDWLRQYEVSADKHQLGL